MRINRNQKSVLTLFIIVFVSLLFGHANIFSIEAIIVWIILGCWFYGVRKDKERLSRD